MLHVLFEHWNIGRLALSPERTRVEKVEHGHQEQDPAMEIC
ncbi:hypothetical protein [Rufibacter aurantiacus]|nr:hypothetical protein [Rufibacter aurantiacus]